MLKSRSVCAATRAMAWMVGEVTAGDRLLVKPHRDEMYHERLIGARLMPAGWWMVATPDNEIHAINLDSRRDFEVVLRMPVDRSLPDGVDEDEVYLFYDGRTLNKDTTAARVRALTQRCIEAAASWRPPPDDRPRRRLGTKSVAAGSAGPVASSLLPIHASRAVADPPGSPSSGGRTPVDDRAIAAMSRLERACGEGSDGADAEDPPLDDPWVWVVASPAHGWPVGAEVDTRS